VDFDPVHKPFTVRLDSRREQVRQRLVDEEKVVVSVREHDRSAVLLRPSLEAIQERGESARALLRI
jgi:hypothetical protein